MNYWFAIDQQDRIEGHKCTVGCQPEQKVPVGQCQTRMKYVLLRTCVDSNCDLRILRCDRRPDALCAKNRPTQGPSGSRFGSGGAEHASALQTALLGSVPPDGLLSLGDLVGNSRVPQVLREPFARANPTLCFVAAQVPEVREGLVDPEVPLFVVGGGS